MYIHIVLYYIILYIRVCVYIYIYIYVCISVVFCSLCMLFNRFRWCLWGMSPGGGWGVYGKGGSGICRMTRGGSFPIDYAMIVSQASVHLASVLCHVSNISQTIHA